MYKMNFCDWKIHFSILTPWSNIPGHTALQIIIDPVEEASTELCLCIALKNSALSKLYRLYLKNKPLLADPSNN